jgi:hypothetical protein
MSGLDRAGCLSAVSHVCRCRTKILRSEILLCLEEKKRMFMIMVHILKKLTCFVFDVASVKTENARTSTHSHIRLYNGWC